MSDIRIVISRPAFDHANLQVSRSTLTRLRRMDSQTLLEWAEKRLAKNVGIEWEFDTFDDSGEVCAIDVRDDITQPETLYERSL